MALAAVRYLNQPAVKDGIKDILGGATFTFGLLEIYQNEAWYTSSKTWTETARKVCYTFFAKASIVLAALTSRPGVIVCSWIAHKIASPETLARLFGQNTVFEINPRHPRHVLSIAASVLALPTVLMTLHNIVFKPKTENQNRRIQMMVCFNFFTGRPFLHTVNSLFLSR